MYSFSTTVESASADDATLVHEPKVDEEAPEDAAVVEPAPISKVKLFVGNLPWELEDRALHELFKPFSPNHSRVARFPDSGKSKGFGFVRFSDSECAQAALRELHGSVHIGPAVLVLSVHRTGIPRQGDRRCIQGPSGLTDELCEQAVRGKSAMDNGRARVERKGW